MTSSITIATEVVLGAAGAGRPVLPASTLVGQPVILDGPSITEAAERAFELWRSRLGTLERSAEASAARLVECVVAYREADARVSASLTALAGTQEGL